MKKKKKSKDAAYEVPMVAYCFACSNQFDTYGTGARLIECPKCSSKDIENWGVEITRVKSR